MRINIIALLVLTFASVGLGQTTQPTAFTMIDLASVCPAEDRAPEGRDWNKAHAVIFKGWLAKQYDQKQATISGTVSKIDVSGDAPIVVMSDMRKVWGIGIHTSGAFLFGRDDLRGVANLETGQTVRGTGTLEIMDVKIIGKTKDGVQVIGIEFMVNAARLDR